MQHNQNYYSGFEWKAVGARSTPLSFRKSHPFVYSHKAIIIIRVQPCVSWHPQGHEKCIHWKGLVGECLRFQSDENLRTLFFPEFLEKVCHCLERSGFFGQMESAVAAKSVTYGWCVTAHHRKLIVWKFIFYKQEVKEDQKALLGQAQNSMKAVLAVQKVFMALQVH